jgi:hypothetical protein
VAILAPYTRGKGRPTSAQVARITSKAAAAFSTNVTPFRKYKDQGSFTKASFEAAKIGLQPGHSEVGRVTLRRKIGEDAWRVEMDGGASDLSRFVARS